MDNSNNSTGKMASQIKINRSNVICTSSERLYELLENRLNLHEHISLIIQLTASKRLTKNRKIDRVQNIINISWTCFIYVSGMLNDKQIAEDSDADCRIARIMKGSDDWQFILWKNK